MFKITHCRLGNSRRGPQRGTLPGRLNEDAWPVATLPFRHAHGQQASLPRRVEPVPEGVARRAKGGARRGRDAINGCFSCSLRMHGGWKTVVQSQVWPAVVVEPHGLLEGLLRLSLGAERPIHFVFLL